mmetsp:Transcript_13678/g.28045  ORF Transcript_13678/g.28045 Transcript_13678/m.28045 type:complete len:89 (+) Transcript_13678:1252-1518(+)
MQLATISSLSLPGVWVPRHYIHHVIDFRSYESMAQPSSHYLMSQSHITKENLLRVSFKQWKSNEMCNANEISDWEHSVRSSEVWELQC